jgi:hypothetical protein
LTKVEHAAKKSTKSTKKASQKKMKAAQHTAKKASKSKKSQGSKNRHDKKIVWRAGGRYGDFVYTLYHKKATWKDARDICESAGASLVDFQSKKYMI